MIRLLPMLLMAAVASDAAADPACLPNCNAANLVGRDLRFANMADAELRGATLAGANLARADLSGADLTFANLARADLIEADLSEAKLYGATLAEANLEGANLSGTDLFGTSLIYADLDGANLTGADLQNATVHRANLSASDLTGANLSRAGLSGANLADAVLRLAQGSFTMSIATWIGTVASVIAAVVALYGAFRLWKERPERTLEEVQRRIPWRDDDGANRHTPTDRHRGDDPLPAEQARSLSEHSGRPRDPPEPGRDRPYRQPATALARPAIASRATAPWSTCWLALPSSARRLDLSNHL